MDVSAHRSMSAMHTWSCASCVCVKASSCSSALSHAVSVRVLRNGSDVHEAAELTATRRSHLVETCNHTDDVWEGEGEQEREGGRRRGGVCGWWG